MRRPSIPNQPVHPKQLVPKVILRRATILVTRFNVNCCFAFLFTIHRIKMHTSNKEFQMTNSGSSLKHKILTILVFYML